MRQHEAAVLIDGKNAGSIFYLCQTEKCDVHNRVTRYQPTPQEQVQRRKEALAERVEKLSRVRVLEAIRNKLPDICLWETAHVGRRIVLST